MSLTYLVASYVTFLSLWATSPLTCQSLAHRHLSSTFVNCSPPPVILLFAAEFLAPYNTFETCAISSPSYHFCSLMTWLATLSLLSLAGYIARYRYIMLSGTFRKSGLVTYPTGTGIAHLHCHLLRRAFVYTRIFTRAPVRESWLIYSFGKWTHTLLLNCHPTDMSVTSMHTWVGLVSH